MSAVETIRPIDPGSTGVAPQAAPGVPGFTTLESEVVVDRLALTGELPAWLEGSLLRTGPARFEVGEQRMRHWFDGLAMLHRFSVAGGEVSYANRYLQSTSYRAATEQGRIAYPEFATDPCRSLFKRVQTMFSPTLSDNANVNVVKLGERFIAMTETPLPVQFDPSTLEAAGVRPYVAPGHLSTAHPHADRSSGAMLNYAAKLGARSSYRFYSVDPGETQPQVIASRAVSEPAYMHSFGLSESYFVLAEFPLVVNPVRLALSGRPYIENYRWKPELGTRFTLIDRRSGVALAGFQADAFFAFHHINSYEERGKVIVDVCAYDDHGIIEDLTLDRLRAGAPMSAPHLRRFVLDVGARSVSSERIGDSGIELPRINYRRCNERRHRYVWGNDAADGWLDRIVKVDVDSGETLVWSEPGCHPGEPVFVAEPGAEREDQGVLLSVVLDEEARRSRLLVLDASTLEERARAEVPHEIPYGFHGQFARGV